MTMEHNSRELANMEVLSARLLHDVAGSIGSVISYVECVLDDPESDDVKGCLEEAVEGMVSRFRFIRQAYSASEDNSSFENTKNHVEQYLKKRGMTLSSWQIEVQFSDTEFVEKVNKLIVQAVLFSAMIMVRGHGISVTVRKSGNTVKLKLFLEAEEVSVHKDIEDIIPCGCSGVLTTHNVQAYFMFLLCQEYRAEFLHDIETKTVEIILTTE